MSEGKFKQFVLEEGEFFDALKHGIHIGVKAFSKKREEQRKQTESKTMALKVLSAEGKELEGLIKQIVNNGFSIQKEVKPQSITDWIK